MIQRKSFAFDCLERKAFHRTEKRASLFTHRSQSINKLPVACDLNVPSVDRLNPPPKPDLPA
jgi:hypothetical protein